MAAARGALEKWPWAAGVRGAREWWCRGPVRGRPARRGLGGRRGEVWPLPPKSIPAEQR
ncbi:hypothetical protein GCM10017786_37420 [Amycolatopsis deserti]|uniref:Uncharacterized protein n=1 Tax=Amycolatopsis deserti TaxID=185696 RepID=A0ABQ3J168_9PSEU|nr:hypothetical protein GCM10017786_37420 [Amycolatopsis deserti]